MNYVLFLFSLVVFLWSFFFYWTVAIYLCSVFCIYEMFAIVVLPGKPRLREIDKRLLLYRMLMVIKNKIRGGWDDYFTWRMNLKMNSVIKKPPMKPPM